MDPEELYLFAEGTGHITGTPEDYKVTRPAEIEVKVGTGVKKYPVAYMWKDVLIPNVAYTKHATAQELHLSSTDLAEMVDTVKQYVTNGNSITIPFRDHEEDRNLGYVIDARLGTGGRLELLHQLIGEKSVEHALQNHVSVLLKRKVIDTKNNEYKNCIVHSSLTDDPVVTGQSAWAPIAASRGGQTVPPLFVFAASRKVTMDPVKLRKLLGLADTVPDAEVFSKALEKLGTVATLETEKVALSSKVTELTTANATMKTELDTKAGEVITLSNKLKPTKPSASELYFAATAASAKRDAALKAKAITPAVAERAQKRFIGDLGLDSFSLSRNVSDNDVALTAGLAGLVDFYDIVKDNQPGPDDKEKTGDQTGNKTIDDKRNDTKTGDDKGGKDDKKDEVKKASEVVSKYLGGRYTGPTGMKVGGK